MTLSINQAVEYAEENLMNLYSVQEWAKELGYNNPKTFSKHFRNHFGKRPSKMLIQLKIISALQLLSSEHRQKNYAIAQEIGLPDEQALYKFLKYHTGKSPSDFKESIDRNRINSQSEILLKFDS